jgi:hypothetical protein
MNEALSRAVLTPESEDAMIGAVAREPCTIWPESTRELGLAEPRVPDKLLPRQCSQSARLFPDHWPLRMQFWEWLRH